MIRATIRNGKIEPLGPLPSDWAEGRELEIQDAEASRESPDEIKKWWNDFNALCARLQPRVMVDAEITHRMPERENGRENRKNKAKSSHALRFTLSAPFRIAGSKQPF